MTTEGERGVHVRVWAPTHERVTLVLESPARRSLVLTRDEDGYHAGFAPGVEPGARYRFQIGSSPELLADPASRFQPHGPLGPSEVIDPRAFPWTDGAWTGIPRHRHVLYELHVGTFTPEGTFAAALAELAALANIGITTIELMPVNESAGRHNWGYDGVNVWAPTHNYGTPDDLRRFVDHAHALGLAVILDVVYNHLGPSGNQMFTWCPAYRGAPGDWGDLLNFDGPASAGVRDFVVANARYWIEEFHLDGLRVDATQAIVDRSTPHVVSEICDAARGAARGRTLFLVGENEPQDVDLYAMGLDALWNDDFHHTARVAATGLIEGYLHDYGGTPQELVSAMTRGFLYQGQLYRWQSNTRGTPTQTGETTIEPARFIHFLENHDQVANIGLGERLIDVTDPATFRAMTAVLLLGPATPMLFQGQEHGSRRPWSYFVDHCDELRAPIRRGRAEFVAQFPRSATPELQAALPDPSDEATFRRCKLDPTERVRDTPIRRLHRDLLRLRREDAVFLEPHQRAVTGAVLGAHAFCLRYFQDDPTRDRLLLVNLGPTFARAELPEPLLAPPRGFGWRPEWSSEHPDYGGHGTPPVFTHARLAIPARSVVFLSPDPSACLRVEPAPPNGRVEL